MGLRADPVWRFHHEALYQDQLRKPMADSKIFQSYISLDMQPNRIRKFKTLALICFFTSCAGMLYQLINESRLDYNSVLIGFPFLFQNTDQLVNQLEDAIDKLLQDKAFVKRLKVE